jgi:hypothetical protein
MVNSHSAQRPTAAERGASPTRPQTACNQPLTEQGATSRRLPSLRGCCCSSNRTRLLRNFVWAHLHGSGVSIGYGLQCVQPRRQTPPGRPDLLLRRLDDHRVPVSPSPPRPAPARPSPGPLVACSRARWTRTLVSVRPGLTVAAASVSAPASVNPSGRRRQAVGIGSAPGIWWRASGLLVTWPRSGTAHRGVRCACAWPAGSRCCSALSRSSRGPWCVCGP